MGVFGVIFLLTITSEEFILPVLQQSAINLASAHGAADTLLVLAESVSQLLFPFMITFLLVFLVIFEYVLGFFAELTRFADRRFYADWWNSTDWLEFSREWNIPVHHFLRRHVYSASAPFIGKSGATLITFLISAVGHEIVMACITKKIRGYGFAAQMSQLPIVMFQRLEWVKRSWALNNASFWCSMILGLSIICSCSGNGSSQRREYASGDWRLGGADEHGFHWEHRQQGGEREAYRQHRDEETRLKVLAVAFVY
jgi:sterol O-acyltransferase